MKKQKRAQIPEADRCAQFIDLLETLPATELLQLRNILAKNAMTKNDMDLIKSYCESSAEDLAAAHLQYRNCLVDEIHLLWQKKALMLRYLLA